MEEFEALLRCGILAHGFARRKCKSCGHERLVAFSCKGRSLCPSCIAKRSALTAAHLCDGVLPIAPYRQWTLSFPKWIRYRLLRDMTLLSRVLRLFIRTVFSWQKRRAKAVGLNAVFCGSVTLIKFFGSLLQATPHFHSWLPDGVFTRAEDGSLTFHRLPPPEDRDIARLCGRIRARVLIAC